MEGACLWWHARHVYFTAAEATATRVERPPAGYDELLRRSRRETCENISNTRPSKSSDHLRSFSRYGGPKAERIQGQRRTTQFCHLASARSGEMSLNSCQTEALNRFSSGVWLLSLQQTRKVVFFSIYKRSEQMLWLINGNFFVSANIVTSLLANQALMTERLLQRSSKKFRTRRTLVYDCS